MDKKDIEKYKHEMMSLYCKGGEKTVQPEREAFPEPEDIPAPDDTAYAPHTEDDKADTPETEDDYNTRYPEPDLSRLCHLSITKPPQRIL